MTPERQLPEGFSELESWVDGWALATREQRYAARLERPYPELVAFYDGIAPHAERAIAYLDGLDINDLRPQDRWLMHLLFSMILVSYAVNIFKQNRIPDSGAAFFDMAVEPSL